MPIQKTILDKYINDVFVETGTEFGDTVQIALDCGFKKIFSIELNPEKVKLCKDRFKLEIEQGRVEIFEGDVIDWFPEVVSKISKTTTFWLDAHWDDGPVGKYKCPLPFELDTILNSGKKNHTILIDDRRIFGGGNWGGGISEDSLKEQLKTINDDYVITTDDGFIPNDVLVAFPPNRSVQ
jgi:hypothetical protein